MKKIVVILLSIFLLTGCTFIDLKDDKVENIINTVIQKDINLYNNIFEGGFINNTFVSSCHNNYF